MKPNCETFDKSWRENCSIVLTSRDSVDDMIRQHYLGKWPGVCVLSLAMVRDGLPIGVIVFALPPRETVKRYASETWELARLWLKDYVPQNAETYFIAKAIRYIRKNHKTVGALVSYADPSVGHAGTIYKAANWIADGRTDQDRKTPRFDYADALTGKHYSRRSHVPNGVEIKRIARTSKHRFVYRLGQAPKLPTL